MTEKRHSGNLRVQGCNCAVCAPHLQADTRHDLRETFSPQMVAAIANTTSTPASRAAIECECRAGRTLIECRDKPRCNALAIPDGEQA